MIFCILEKKTTFLLRLIVSCLYFQVDWISQIHWNLSVDMGDALSVFKGIDNDLTQTPCWVQIGDVVVRANPETDAGYGPEPAVPDPPKPKTGEEEEEKQEEYDGKVCLFIFYLFFFCSFSKFVFIVTCKSLIRTHLRF